jgi:putative transposase
MSGAEEERKRAARAEQVALFRYQLVREAADPALSTRQRGRMVREIASRAHEGPFGEPVTVSRGTVDRWIRAWRDGGFAALAPPARQVTLRTDAEVLEMAAGLKRESPARTAAQVRRILVKACGWSPSVRTLQRHFERLELRTRPDGTPPEVFGRFECAAPNEMWTGDALCRRRHKASYADPAVMPATAKIRFRGIGCRAAFSLGCDAGRRLAG